MSHLHNDGLLSVPDLPTIPSIDDDVHSQSHNLSDNSHSTFSHINNRPVSSPMSLSSGMSDQSINQISHQSRPMHPDLYYNPNQSINQSSIQPNHSYLQGTFNQAAPYTQSSNQSNNLPMHQSMNQYNSLPNLPNLPYGGYQQQMSQSINQSNYQSLGQPPGSYYLPPFMESNKRKADEISPSSMSNNQSFIQSSGQKKQKKAKSPKSKFDLPPCVNLVQCQRKAGPKVGDLIESKITGSFLDVHAANYEVLSNADEWDEPADVKMADERVTASTDAVVDRSVNPQGIFDEYKVIEVSLKTDEGSERKTQKMIAKMQKKARIKDESSLTGAPSIRQQPWDPSTEQLPDFVFVVGEQQRRSGNRSRPLNTVKWPAVFFDLAAANLHAMTTANDMDGTIEQCHIDPYGCVRIYVDKGDGLSAEFGVTQVPFDSSMVAESESLRLFRRIKAKGRPDMKNVEYEYDTEGEEDFDSDDHYSDDDDE